MTLAEILQKRLDELDWTQYKLAQEVMKLKAMDGPATNLSSSIARWLKQPENAKVENLRDVVKALGGEIVIRFPEDYTVK
jgi:hypothetical protein